MYSHTFATKFKQMCGSSHHDDALRPYSEQVAFMEFKEDRLQQNQNAVIPDADRGVPPESQCQDWSTFTRLVVVVASVDALTAMNDEDCALFWKVLHAPNLQHLVVWDDRIPARVTLIPLSFLHRELLLQCSRTS